MKKFSRSLNLLANKKGSTQVIIVCTILIIILVSAVLADIGYAALENLRLNKNAEKVATFGAYKLIQKNKDVEAEVRKFAVKNISELNELDIRISNNLKDITINIEKPFSYYFLHLIGFREKQIKAKYTARISNITSVIGTRPFAIEKRKLPYGKKIFLSSNRTETSSTHIVPIDLGEGSYKSNIIYGYRKLLNIGDGIFSLQGDLQKATDEGFTAFFNNQKKPYDYADTRGVDEKRIIIIPVVDKLEFSGKKAMNIVGFAAFYLRESRTYKSNIIISGEFLRWTVKGNTSDGVEDYGLTGIRLIH